MLFDGTVEFAYPSFLYLLIPVVMLLFLRRREGASGSIAFSTLHFLAPWGKRPGGRVGLFGLLILILALAAGVIALARPQIVNEKEFTTASGIDILIAFDLSGSMETRDMVVNQRRVDRLTAAKLVIQNFITKRPDDRLGLVAFAGRPKMYSPLTLDHELVLSQIEQFDPQLMGVDGTAIGSAIAAAATRLQDRKDTKSKIIILVTDGASNSGELTPKEAATLAAKMGIKIYTIAVGTEGGRLGSLTSPKQEFDEDSLKEIAKITGGEHFRARDTQMFLDAFNSIDKLEKSEAKRHTIRREFDLFPWFVGLSAILMVLGIFVEIVRPRPAP